MTKSTAVTLIKIRPLFTIEEMEEVVELEVLIWGLDDPVPISHLLTSVKNGGLVLGAYHNDQLIGFQYSFAGFHQGKSYLCSHILGVHPDYQKRGIGEQLKQAQREQAIRLGYDLITWTFDPLESVNAYLNIHKLGAISSTYLENCYGEMNDDLNRGLPTDRLQVEWWISRKPLSENTDKGDLNLRKITIGDWSITSKGLPSINDVHQDVSGDLEADVIQVAIPSFFQRIKEQDPVLARNWRYHIRSLLSDLFQHGWTICDFIRSDHQAVNFYLLRKRSDLPLPPRPF